MEGSFEKGRIGDNGNLRINVTNISEFNELVKKAEKEADQLNETINQLRNFELIIEFSTKSANHPG